MIGYAFFEDQPELVSGAVLASVDGLEMCLWEESLFMSTLPVPASVWKVEGHIKLEDDPPTFRYIRLVERRERVSVGEAVRGKVGTV
ncbi:hypothetical protein CMI37_22630 [Candidatus Pacearchaeota archaeon]|nr:hypothetical protein [Candidatus Pacearchaeota archaeon]